MQRPRFFRPTRSDFFELFVCIALAALFVLLSSGAAFAQGNVGINNATPHVKSLLDLTSTDKGLLTPRMTAAQRTAIFSAADATGEGMLVYQTDGAQGFYYYDGAAWSMLQNGAAGWGLLGNTGTNPTTNFVGTTDNQPLVFRTNNVERARLDADGDLGLGVANPLWRLDAQAVQAVGRFVSTGHVNGSVVELRNMTPGAGGMLGAVNFNDAPDVTPGQVGYGPTQGMTFRSGGVERMRMQPNGWLGIGTNAPIVPVDILNTMAITRQTSTNSVWGSVLELKNTTAGTNGLGAINFNDAANTFPGQINYHPTDGMTFRSGGGERMRMLPNGCTGLGVTTPICMLDIASAQATERITSTNAPNGAVIELKNNTAGTNLLGALNFNDGANNYAGQLAYHAADGMTFRSGGIERMRIKSNGNVGIGTNAPFYNLDIASTAQVVERLTTAGHFWGSVLELKNTTPGTNYLGAINFNDVGGSVPAQVAYHPTNGMTFATGNAERMRVQPNGYVGIGTAAPLDVLHVAGNIRMVDGTQAAGKVLTSDANGRATWQTVNAGNVGAWSLTGNAGTAPATNFLGTTDNQALAFRTNNAERMRVTETGNVGIGTAAPASKLHVTSGSAGYAPNAQSGLTVEGSGNVYANVMSATGATGILFGSSANAQNGGVLYNAVGGYPNAMELRTGGNITRMSITDQGNVAIGTGVLQNACRLSVFGANPGALTWLWNNDNAGLSGTTYSSSVPAITSVTGWANSAYPTSPNSLLHGTMGANPVTFMTANTERMRIMANGNVGIGTSTPFFNLDIAAPTQTITRLNSLSSATGSVLELTNSTAGSNGLGAIVFNDGLGTVPGQIAYHATTGLGVRVGGTERLTILPMGFVGIGTATPTGHLHVVGQNTTTKFTATNSGTGSVLVLENTQAGASYLGQVGFVDATNSVKGNVSYHATNGMQLWTNASARLTVTPAGNIGIGTFAPASELEVNGYTKLGSNAPAVKLLKLTGTTNATQGGWTDLLHGLTAAKILSVEVLVEFTPGSWVPMRYSAAAGFSVTYLINGTAIRVVNETGNSGSVLSKPMKILVTYEA